MKITINIPKEFEEHFNSDRFKESLLRLCFDANCLAGSYEQEIAIMLIIALENAEVESDEQYKWADMRGDSEWSI